METLIIIALAVWRVTSIINREKIFERFRVLLGEKLDPDTGITHWPDKFFANLVMCFWCLSVWVSVGMVILYYVYPPLVTVFAVAGGALIVEKVING